MSKVIAVLRHAQSAGKQSGQRDYDRILTPAGEDCARWFGKNLSLTQFTVELIVSSGSVRTRLTVQLSNEYLRLPEDKIWFKHELYEALMIDWLEQIHNLPQHVQHVMLVGHNPCLSMLASHFAGAPTDLETCEMAAFKFNMNSWQEIRDRGKEILRIKPAIQ
jgi:phosphohistidine phosphatase